jgi:hypothetical protein
MVLMLLAGIRYLLSSGLRLSVVKTLRFLLLKHGDTLLLTSTQLLSISRESDGSIRRFFGEVKAIIDHVFICRF